MRNPNDKLFIIFIIVHFHSFYYASDFLIVIFPILINRYYFILLLFIYLSKFKEKHNIQET